MSADTTVLQPSECGPSREWKETKFLSWQWFLGFFIGRPRRVKRPPTGVRTAFGYMTLVLMLYVVETEGGWDRNLFHRFVTNMTQVLNLSECWVCAHGPSYHGQGWPIIPTALLTLKGWNHTSCCDNYTAWSKNKVQFMVTHRHPIMEAPLCLKWDHNGTKYKLREHPKKKYLYRFDVGSYPLCRYTIMLHDEHLTDCETHVDETWEWGREFSNCTHVLYGNRLKLALVNIVQNLAVNSIGSYLGGLPPGLLWICGNWAGRQLPPAWHGICTVGTLGLGGLRVYPKDTPVSNIHMHLYKRTADQVEKYGYDPDRTYLTEWQRFIAIGMPRVGVGWNIKQIRILSYGLEQLANETILGWNDLQTEINSLAGTQAQHRLALDYLLAKEGGLCVWLNTTCCNYINESGKMELRVEKLQEIARTVQKSYESGDTWGWLTSWLPSAGWLRSLVVTCFTLICIMGIVLCCLPVMLKFCISTVCQSSRSENIAMVQRTKDWRRTWRDP